MTQHTTRNVPATNAGAVTTNEQADRLRLGAEGLRQRQAPRDQGPRREPPKESGKRLGTLKRGENDEVRINWDEYEGNPFLSIRLWTRGNDDNWYPDKKGITIRKRELADFADAISAAILEAAAGVPRGEQRSPDDEMF